MPSMTIYITDELRSLIDSTKPKIQISKICSTALKKALTEEEYQKDILTTYPELLFLQQALEKKRPKAALRHIQTILELVRKMMD